MHKNGEHIVVILALKMEAWEVKRSCWSLSKLKGSLDIIYLKTIKSSMNLLWKLKLEFHINLTPQNSIHLVFQILNVETVLVCRLSKIRAKGWTVLSSTCLLIWLNEHTHYMGEVLNWDYILKVPHIFLSDYFTSSLTLPLIP